MRHDALTAAVLTAALGATAVAGSDGKTETPDGIQVVDTLEGQVAALERQLELAKSPAFYLLLDPGDAELRLMYGGAVLQRYPVSTFEVGHPRAAFVEIGGTSDWHATIWNEGTLAPPRPVDEQPQIQPVDPEAAEEPPPVVIPPTAEESIPVPEQFRIRFDGGLALEILSQPDSEDADWWTRLRRVWANRWRDVLSVLRPSDRDAVRIRVALARDDAGSLYRALPPQTSLLIVLPSPAP